MVYRGGLLNVVPLDGVPGQDEEDLFPFVEDPRRVLPDNSRQNSLWQTASVIIILPGIGQNDSDH